MLFYHWPVLGDWILIPSLICLESTRMYFLVNTSHLWVVARISQDSVVWFR